VLTIFFFGPLRPAKEMNISGARFVAPSAKLGRGSERFELVAHMLRKAFAPERLPARLRMHMDHTPSTQRCLRLS